MNKEFLKMQKTAGLITESQYHQLVENLDVEKFKQEATNFINKHMDIIHRAIEYYVNAQDDVHSNHEEGEIGTIYDFLTDELGNDWGWTTHNTGSEEENTYVNGWTDEKDEIFTNLIHNLVNWP